MSEQTTLEMFEKELKEKIEMEDKLKKQGVAKGKITKVEEGTLKDFLTEDILQKFNMDGDKEAMKVYVEIENVKDVITELFTLSTHKRAKARKFYETYGSIPKEGMEVNLKFNRGKERWEIII